MRGLRKHIVSWDAEGGGDRGRLFTPHYLFYGLCRSLIALASCLLTLSYYAFCQTRRDVISETKTSGKNLKSWKNLTDLWRGRIWGARRWVAGFPPSPAWRSPVFQRRTAPGGATRPKNCWFGRGGASRWCHGVVFASCCRTSLLPRETNTFGKQTEFLI